MCETETEKEKNQLVYETEDKAKHRYSVWEAEDAEMDSSHMTQLNWFKDLRLD